MANVAVSFQSGVELSVTRFSVQEHLSAAFQVQLDATGEPDIDPRSIVGHAAAFALQAGNERRVWTGVCTRISQTQVNGETAGYSVTLAPAVWLMSRRRNYRVFAHKTAVEIAQQMLTEWGVPSILKLGQEYPKLEYRVQYGETDYNFLRRQLSSAGISFFFQTRPTPDHKSEETVVVLSDAPETGARRPALLPFLAESGLSDARAHVSNVTVTSEVRPGLATVRDHDFRRPVYALMGSHVAAATPESLLEEYTFEPGSAAVGAAADGTSPVGDAAGAYRSTEAAASARAKVVGESLRPGGLTVHLTASVVDLYPGAVFGVTGHPHPQVSSAAGLLVVEAWISGNTQGEWTMTAVTVPAGEPFCPPQPVVPARPSDHTGEPDIFTNLLVPQKPTLTGLANAIVVGPAGEEIFTDELGRVRVQFPWDREGAYSESASCWVRVSQAWAGAGYGATFLPRVGQEVLVAFVGGDPDLPIVVGCVHGPTMPAPYALPAHKTKLGIRSSSTAGGQGYCEVMIDDAKGREQLSLRSERDMNVVAQNDRMTRVGKVDSTAVGERLAFHIADSNTGIEMTRGKIVLTTGDAMLILEGGEVSIVAKGAVGVRSSENAATPSWKDGAPKRDVTGIAPAAPVITEPKKLPVVPSQRPRTEPCVRLGKNKPYKGAILEASRRTGVAPYAIAAMIDAEAAKTGAGVWNPDSKASTSSAVGLTQFLKGTWLEMAVQPGTALNQAAEKAGWVTKAGKTFSVVPDKSDEILALRNNPDLSIITGAEYAKGNLDALEKAGLLTDATPDDQRARLAYLAHHEGLGGAKSFLRGTLTEERATELLRANAGSKRAAELIAQEGSARTAYTHWLNAYIDKKIVPSRYRCTNEAVDGDEAPAAQA